MAYQEKLLKIIDELYGIKQENILFDCLKDDPCECLIIRKWRDDNLNKLPQKLLVVHIENDKQQSRRLFRDKRLIYDKSIGLDKSHASSYWVFFCKQDNSQNDK